MSSTRVAFVKMFRWIDDSRLLDELSTYLNHLTMKIEYETDVPDAKSLRVRTYSGNMEFYRGELGNMWSDSKCSIFYDNDLKAFLSNHDYTKEDKIKHYELFFRRASSLRYIYIMYETTFAKFVGPKRRNASSKLESTYTADIYIPMLL